MINHNESLKQVLKFGATSKAVETLDSLMLSPEHLSSAQKLAHFLFYDSIETGNVFCCCFFNSYIKNKKNMYIMTILKLLGR